MSVQVKSKQRVGDHGEVFTNEREVNAMLNMVKQETKRIDSRFLEPACGNGNFLAEILRRKLDVVKSRYGKNLYDYEKYCFVAVGSIYGVELLPDNVQECRERLYNIIEAAYKRVARKAMNQQFLVSIKYVLSKNILCGDALNLKDANSNPIIFSEWSLTTGDKVKRRDFRFDEMMEGGNEQPSLFGSGGSAMKYDAKTKTYMPLPIREYPLISCYEVSINE